MGTASRPRTRFGQSVVCCAVVLAVWAVTGMQASDAAEPAAVPVGDVEASSDVVVVVAEGETVWDLVLPYAPAGSDPHEWVALVARHNDVEPRAIRPGEVLRVPIG
jgi:hypothetical protein